MEKSRNTLLVTWDNTEMSENALLHALRIGKQVNNNIRLVHIIEASKAKNNLEKIENEFQGKVEQLSKLYEYELQGVVLTGSIFKRIAKYANETDALMVIMGTHGIKGIQKYTGSWALKVIVGSSVPFLVIQDKPSSKDRFNSIVFPIDFKAENKEKLKWAIYLGKYFNSKVYLFKAPVTDKGLLKKVNRNLTFAVKFLIQNNLDYEIHTAKKSSKFARETLDFASQKKTDLILITTTKNISIADYLLGASEQYIIANSNRIPVMCVNPRAAYVNVGQFMWGSRTY
ncbi:MAG: universal stress protein [Bacteroidales bacterium]|nr:universal stress protein [Bacteroidales bacterium]